MPPATAYNPQARRVFRDVAVQDAPSIMSDHEEAVQHTEPDSGNREEIHRCNRFPMIPEKGQPMLDGSGSLRARFIQREMVRSKMSKPNISSSP